MNLPFEVKKTFGLPAGGTVTVTVGSGEPIDEAQYLSLQPKAAIAMADYLLTLASAMRPSSDIPK